ncbi:MAG: tyrosine--tRNA ligase [Patescibacteria group bacterium]
MKAQKEKINEILDRGVVVQVFPDKKEFAEALATRKLRFYIGADPTSTALHLSHAKNYMLLEEFRKLGHEVIVLIGDFTARIGDPTDKATTRKQLTRDEIMVNVKSWVEQIKPLMDFNDIDNPPLIKYNHDWLAKLTMEEVVNLASNVTAQQMLERDMFQKRLAENKPIYLHEFMYPLMQGYDSVAMDVDVELCGTDQIFNALMGRTLLKKLRNKDKFVVAVNLMENPKTKELMSKSRGTGIFLNASSADMFAGIMAQPDEMIDVFLINNTRIPLSEIKEIMGAANPRDAKIRAAYEVTKIFHGEKEAQAAQADFVSKFQKREIPEDMEALQLGAVKLSLYEIVKKLIPETSNSDIKRLFVQGGIKIDDASHKDTEEIMNISAAGLIIKIGKRRWFKVTK